MHEPRIADTAIAAYEADAFVRPRYASVDTAAKAIRLGAFDYQTKPFGEIELLTSSIDRAIEKRALEQGLRERTAELERSNTQLQAEITDRKEAEEALHLRTQELDQRVREITALNNMFQEHLPRRSPLAQAYVELREGLERLLREPDVLPESDPAHSLPDPRQFLSLALNEDSRQANDTV